MLVFWDLVYIWQLVKCWIFLIAKNWMFIMTSLNGNTFHVTDTLREESTDHCNTPEAILGQFDAEWFGPTSATTGRYG